MEKIPETLSELSGFLFFYGFVFAFSLAIIILIHEFGHYIVARWCGVRVHKFSIGFGRELFGIEDKAGTRWSLSIFPIGGYVKLFGDLDPQNPVIYDPEIAAERKLTELELKQAFCMKKIWQRAAIVIAGPAINMLFAVVILIGLYSLYGQGSQVPVINALCIGTSSYDDGFQLGDEVLEMDGKKIRRWADVHNLTWSNPNKKYTYKVKRDNQTIEITSAAREVKYVDKKGVSVSHGRTGMIRLNAIKYDEFASIDGTQIDEDPDKAREILKEKLDQTITIGLILREDKTQDMFVIKFPSEFNKDMSDPESDNHKVIFVTDPEEKLYLRLGLIESSKQTYYILSRIFDRAFQLAKVAFKGKTDEPVLGGVAKMSEDTGNAAKQGIHNYIHFLAVMSFGIALINLLPVPLLDGGFLLFLIYESVTGKQLSPRIQNYAFAIGLAFLGGIMIIANLSDLLRLLL